MAEPTMPKPCGIPFSFTLIHPRYWLSWLMLSMLFFLSLLPTAIRHRLGRLLGNYIYKNNRKRRNIVKANLRVVFPDISDAKLNDMSLQSLQWYACAMIDYSLLFFARKKRLKKMIRIDGKEYLDQAISRNQSVIILLAHSAMLEFAPATLGYYFETFGSYKTSKNALVDWMIAKGRCRFVRFVVSRDEGLRKLVKALTPGRLMIFLPDEDLGIDNATFVPFFGKEKATLTTTARITKMGKAAAFPVFSWYDTKQKKYCTQILPALENYPTGDAKTDATRLNQALEALIKQHPEQYMWQMKWYRTRPDNESTIYS